MNESETTAANTQEVCPLHEAGNQLAMLERRMAEAKDRAENAYWMDRSWTRVERLLEEYADARHEYKVAKKSAAIQDRESPEHAGPEGYDRATLFGIPVDFFVWDGTEEHAAAVLQRKHQDHVMLANGGVPILHFRGARGNAHIIKGGWILRFNGKNTCSRRPRRNRLTTRKQWRTTISPRNGIPRNMG